MGKNTQNKIILTIIQLYWIMVSIICIKDFSGDGNYFYPLGYIALICILISFVFNKYHIIGIILLFVSIFIDIGLFLVIGFAYNASILIIFFLCLIIILNICSSIYLMIC